MPLVLLSFHRLSVAGDEGLASPLNSEKRARRLTRHAIIPSQPVIFAAFSLAALFCCHVLTAIAFAPVAIVYALSLGRATFGRAVMAGAWSLCVSAVYLLPAALYSDYVSGSNNAFFMGESFRTTFFFPDLQLQRPTFNNQPLHHYLFVTFAGQLFIQVLCIVALLFRIVPDSGRRQILLLILLLHFCVCMMLPVSEPLYVVFPFLQRLQFTWRFLSPTTLICTMMISVLLVQKRNVFLKHWMVIGAATVAFILTALYVNFQVYRVNFSAHDAVRQEEPASIDYHRIDAFGEYVPAGANIPLAEQFFEATTNKTPSAFRLISGDGQVAVTRQTARRFTIESDSENWSEVVLHQFWFPGWSARDLASGEIIPVTQHHGDGLLEVSIPGGRRRIDLRLSMLRPEAAGIAISSVSASWLLAVIAGRFLGRKRTQVENISAAAI